MMGVILQIGPWVPTSPSELGIIGLLLSHVLLWTRLLQLDRDVKILTKRFESQFVEVSKEVIVDERERSPDKSRSRYSRTLGR